MTTESSAAGPLPHWDADSPTLRANLDVVDAKIHADASSRTLPTFEDARDWHVAKMKGLDPRTKLPVVGNFRGEPGLETVGVRVGSLWGTDPWKVGLELQAFEDDLHTMLRALDASYPDAASLDDAGRSRVISTAARVHSEWVRIHPFANGNGRTARMWANLILLRYGMPAVMRLRPRPSGVDEKEYADAGAAGMRGDARPARAYIRRKYDEAINASVAARIASADRLPGTASAELVKNPSTKTPAKRAPSKKTK